MSSGEEKDPCSNVFNYIKTRNIKKLSNNKYKKYLGCTMSLEDLNTNLKLGFENNTTDLNKRLGLESGNPQITPLFFAQNITLFEMESLRLKFKHLEDSLPQYLKDKNPFLSSEGGCKQKIFYSILYEDGCKNAYNFLTELLNKIKNINMINLFEFYYSGIDDDEDFIRDKFTDINLSDLKTFEEFYMLFLKTKKDITMTKIIELIESTEPISTQAADTTSTQAEKTPWWKFGGSKKRKTIKRKSKKRNAKKNKSKRRV